MEYVISRLAPRGTEYYFYWKKAGHVWVVPQEINEIGISDEFYPVSPKGKSQGEWEEEIEDGLLGHAHDPFSNAARVVLRKHFDITLKLPPPENQNKNQKAKAGDKTND